ncbi:uncharacterized protein Bfra_005727 [Botrytis fragariae]|uniref:Uncharacterized protein n=1 Tax=Botrytis fragariae TaxID=1964551 RepID=A0A8H6ART3_9HELO|nr:uncharacterized protein Bfra_005727 [Botrytis fragariae]KAF5872368.1 hypothetical protein Bfra_005727 [Botrytis fragariae]
MTISRPPCLTVQISLPCFFETQITCLTSLQSFVDRFGKKGKSEICLPNESVSAVVTVTKAIHGRFKLILVLHDLKVFTQIAVQTSFHALDYWECVTCVSEPDSRSKEVAERLIRVSCTAIHEIVDKKFYFDLPIITKVICNILYLRLRNIKSTKSYLEEADREHTKWHRIRVSRLASDMSNHFLASFAISFSFNSGSRANNIPQRILRFNSSRISHLKRYSTGPTLLWILVPTDELELQYC